jgi:hypothetical protein
VNQNHRGSGLRTIDSQTTRHSGYTTNQGLNRTALVLVL